MVIIRHGGTLTESAQPFDSQVIEGNKFVSQNLSDTVISFDGDDVRDVLHGQTTRNFKALEPNTPIDGAFCDVKGRVITDFTAILITETSVIMRVSDQIAPLLQQHLTKYLMFSKTKVTMLEWRCWGCRSNDRTDRPGLRIERSNGYCELWSSDTSEPEDAISPEEWLAYRISHGSARIAEHNIGKYLPQDLNYDLNGYIDFDKGCYTGQEIIARLHYRGQPKRRLSLLGVKLSKQPRSDEKVIDSATGKSIGSLVESVRRGDTYLCLCEVVIDVADLDVELCGQTASTLAFE